MTNITELLLDSADQMIEPLIQEFRGYSESNKPISSQDIEDIEYLLADIKRYVQFKEQLNSDIAFSKLNKNVLLALIEFNIEMDVANKVS